MSMATTELHNKHMGISIPWVNKITLRPAKNQNNVVMKKLRDFVVPLFFFNQTWKYIFLLSFQDLIFLFFFPLTKYIYFDN